VGYLDGPRYSGKKWTCVKGASRWKPTDPKSTFDLKKPLKAFSFYKKKSVLLLLSHLFFNRKVTHTRSINEYTQPVMLTHYSPTEGLTPLCYAWSQAYSSTVVLTMMKKRLSDLLHQHCPTSSSDFMNLTTVSLAGGMDHNLNSQAWITN
jgi:hypothetical protein